MRSQSVHVGFVGVIVPQFVLCCREQQTICVQGPKVLYRDWFGWQFQGFAQNLHGLTDLTGLTGLTALTALTAWTGSSQGLDAASTVLMSVCLCCCLAKLLFVSSRNLVSKGQRPS